MRNSVKVVIDAYSGQMTFYDADPKDPILQAYSAAFPGMFKPLSQMNPRSCRPTCATRQDIFSIQSAIFGRYHLTNPQNFYAASNAWQLSPTAGAGPQSQALLAQNTYNSQGQLVSTTPARMAPQYQVYCAARPPSQQAFTVSDGFVPASQSTLSGSNQNFNLTAWMVGQSDPAHYGQLNLYEVPQGTPGPANADAEISANQAVSSEITLLNQHGLEVLLGETLMVPIANSMVYLRPLYIGAATNPQPQLAYVSRCSARTWGSISPFRPCSPTCCRRRCPCPGSGRALAATVPAAVAGILQTAQTDYTNAQAALRLTTSRTYQTGHHGMEQAITASAADPRDAAAGHVDRRPRRPPRPPVKARKRRRRRTRPRVRRRRRRPRSTSTGEHPTERGRDHHVDHCARRGLAGLNRRQQSFEPAVPDPRGGCSPGEEPIAGRPVPGCGDRPPVP